MPLPYPCVIKLKDGRKQTGVICGGDNVIIFKTRLKGSIPLNDTIQIKKILSDTALSKREKDLQMILIKCPDTINYLYDSISKIHFDLFYKKRGIARAVIGTTALATGFFIFYAFLFDDRLDLPVATGPIALVAGFYTFRTMTTKNIRTKRWSLKENYYEVTPSD